MPLQRRLPKLRGFRPRTRKQYHLVNLEKLNDFADGEIITPEIMLQKRLVKKLDKQVKILGSGELEKSLTVKAHAFTRSAAAKIEAAGGSIEVV